jgi:hypothetical protein
MESVEHARGLLYGEPHQLASFSRLSDLQLVRHTPM